MPSYEHALTRRQERRKHGNNGGASADKATNIVDTTLGQEVIKQKKYREDYTAAVTAGRAFKREGNGSWYGPISEPEPEEPVKKRK